MLFNSVTFAIFLPLVFGLYWLSANRRVGARNLLIVIASYVFYGWWDWRFLSLIVLSTLVDFAVGLLLGSATAKPKRRLLLGVSLATNIGLLGFFKYFGFFVQSWIDAWQVVGVHMQGSTLNIILPVGISFYTFQTLSYTIDVYRGRVEPTRNLLAFAAFVSFFPQLVAGPIERATHLLPQFFARSTFDYGQAADGLRRMLWGLLKKIVIADNLGLLVDRIFADPAAFSGLELWLGTCFFAFQIYCDFSGYSDIAIGVAQLFGFKLRENFLYPYFSRDIAEFWRRWHVSLTTWFRDYLYIPLGGSRGPRWQMTRNVFVIFAVSGFWHGANWTFIAWGLLNALLFLPLILSGRNRRYQTMVAAGALFPTLRESIHMVLTFVVTCFAWIFFRAESLSQAVGYLTHMIEAWFVMPSHQLFTGLAYIIPFITVEWFTRHYPHPLQVVSTHRPVVRHATYLMLLVVIFLLGYRGENHFIYFQF